MANLHTVVVPDLGDFDKVPIIEVLVAEGDQVGAEQSLLVLESDKASMEVPAPAAGTIARLLVAEGDEVSAGDPIVELDQGEAGETASEPPPAKTQPEPEDTARAQQSSEPAPAPHSDVRAEKQESSERPDRGDHEFDLAVLGSGPGGYTAAFRAADLGLKVALIERYEQLGGVCLNVGCIPSKALLHAAEVMESAREFAEHGIAFGEPDLDHHKLAGWQQGVVKRLTGGVAQMAKQRKVTVVHGTGLFTDPHTIRVDDDRDVTFAQAIIAAGSEAVHLPFLPWDDERVMDSTDALELAEIPARLLIIGGGIIGCEMACVYSALGSKVTIVEMLDQLMPGADKDLLRPFERHMKDRLENVFVHTKVTACTAAEDGLTVQMEGEKAPAEDRFDRILCAVGRTPNGNRIGLDKTGVHVSERGFVPVDDRQRTNVEHLFAIGDIVGQPLLAHKASHEGKVAAEVAAGEKAAFDARVIPSVAYTDPEIAWAGITESEAKEKGISYEVGKFPWAASGRALGMARSEGLTKLLFDPGSRRLIGAGIVGVHAGDLIAECCHAIEMGSVAEDIGLTIHPHPTLAETVGFAAEAFAGTITDLYLPKKK